jgi:hypothetical protein
MSTPAARLIGALGEVAMLDDASPAASHMRRTTRLHVIPSAVDAGWAKGTVTAGRTNHHVATSGSASAPKDIDGAAYGARLKGAKLHAPGFIRVRAIGDAHLAEEADDKGRARGAAAAPQTATPTA